MIQFILQLFSLKKDHRTVVILDEDGSEEVTQEYEPQKLWMLSAAVLVVVVILVIFLMMFTPLGGFVYKQQKLRQSVVKMQRQVAMLEDSMRARNIQLRNLRMALFSGKDSLFPEVSMIPKESTKASRNISPDTVSSVGIEKEQPLNINTVTRLGNSVQFPASWPLDGMITRDFNAKNGHYGIDITGNKGEKFYAIAEGVIVGVNRSLKYGNVLYIQHGNGLLTIYKHASALLVALGEIISTGDVLGRVGNTGIVSSGPHLHMEIWVNGIPQNPLHYLIDK